MKRLRLTLILLGACALPGCYQRVVDAEGVGSESVTTYEANEKQPGEIEELPERGNLDPPD